ncbi:DinB family protein [Echinicola vietnamensis]|uniref:DinB-like domain-containing protein n=1 Tax=Echinicola vietnamensis (strain DSM 17526 / LMG 23754 / KMM 6221) TaxID=926556 RepID=L0FUW4_ECHVK|nr:DinB family protein [Echinicola vietnamensis]AGA77689.1 hypothetical protein Echvi_1422 [Echinicola vietnamensis DSM 17526]
MKAAKDVFEAFEEISSQLISHLKALSENQLNAIPFEGSWTAAQVGDHLFKSYAVVHTLKGNTTACDRKVDQKVWDIKNVFLDFTIKMASPEAILPETSPISKAQLIGQLTERIEQLKALKDEDLQQVCLDFIIPEYGEFTRLEWMWFTVFHTRRHVYQLEKIMGNLPKNFVHHV